MGDVPLTVFLPFLMIPLVIFMYVNGRKRQAQYLKENPQYGVGVLAQRWLLQLVEGDPSYNLFINDRGSDVSSATPGSAFQSARQTAARVARMQGEHRGHPVRFEFFDQTEIDRGFNSVTHSRAYVCQLSVGVSVPIPSFEIVLRNENQYFRVERKVAAPQQSFGQHAIDQVLTLASTDSRVGPALAPVVGPLVAMQYVHVVGGDGVVRFLMSPLGTASALYYAESLLQVLLAMTDVFEGRAPVLPNALPPAPPR